MALSPWHVASRLSGEEVAALLGGYDIAHTKTGDLPQYQLEELNEWLRVIVEAAKAGEIEPWSIYELTPDPDGFVEIDNLQRYRPDFSWQCRQRADLEWKKASDVDLKLIFERQEVYRWLLARGIPRGDIPEALRVMPADSQPQSEELNPRRESTYQSIIAALLAMQYSAEDLKEPYRLAEEVRNDCQAQNIKAPAGRTKLGDLFKQLSPVQQAPSD